MNGYLLWRDCWSTGFLSEDPRAEGNDDQSFQLIPLSVELFTPALVKKSYKCRNISKSPSCTRLSQRASFFLNAFVLLLSPKMLALNQGCGVGSPVIRLRLLAISIIRLRPSAVLVTWSDKSCTFQEHGNLF